MRFAVFAAALVVVSAACGAIARVAGWGPGAAWATALAVLLAGQALYLIRVAWIARAEARRRAAEGRANGAG